jgi:hypothetical protein
MTRKTLRTFATSYSEADQKVPELVDFVFVLHLNASLLLTAYCLLLTSLGLASEAALHQSLLTSHVSLLTLAESVRGYQKRWYQTGSRGRRAASRSESRLW